MEKSKTFNGTRRCTILWSASPSSQRRFSVHYKSFPTRFHFDFRDYIFSTVTKVRAYEWSLKEAEELFEDLLDGSNCFLAGDAFRRDYELSQIVVVPMEWDKELYDLGNRYNVHDGQQRLVTLCLLFVALRNSFAKDDDMDDSFMELADVLKPPLDTWGCWDGYME